MASANLTKRELKVYEILATGGAPRRLPKNLTKRELKGSAWPSSPRPRSYWNLTKRELKVTTQKLADGAVTTQRISRREN